MKAIDLFAGAGGFSTGAMMAGCEVIWAANHWQLAVNAHAENHPNTIHHCQDLHQADWSKVPDHDLMLASPACQGHSKARGKDRAHHDACRSTAWAVVSCAEIKRPRFILVENVPEFYQWQLFPVWKEALKVLGYRLNENVFNAADFGVPQNRERAFILCSLETEYALTLTRQPHKTAFKIIDFFRGKWSAITKPGRAEATLTQIENGKLIHGNRFLIAYYGNERNGRSLHKPIGTITTRDRFAIINNDKMRMLTVDEARKAMGFPDDYKLPENKRLAMHFLGNAVCPPVAAGLIRQIRGFQCQKN